MRWPRAVNIALAAAIAATLAGCAGPKKNVKKRPVQPISSLATRRAQEGSPVVRGMKSAGKATWNGSVWVVKELLSPLDALRKGMIDLFGVTTEETVTQRNLPPQGFQPQR